MQMLAMVLEIVATIGAVSYAILIVLAVGNCVHAIVTGYYD